jgi:CheY-like chemotaxis protein
MRPELGLELASRYRPDLILLDLHLPDMPGETVLRRPQSNPEMAGIPVVILSADARPSLIQRLLEPGGPELPHQAAGREGAARGARRGRRARATPAG